MKTIQEKINGRMALIAVCKRLVMAGITLASVASGAAIIASFDADRLKTKQTKNNK